MDNEFFVLKQKEAKNQSENRRVFVLGILWLFDQCKYDKYFV